jgi:hypothetical protein
MCSGRPGPRYYAQEKPDLDEQPESAPDGIWVPELPAIRKLEAEIFFWTLVLPQWVQVMTSAEVAEVRIFSKGFLQSRH